LDYNEACDAVFSDYPTFAFHVSLDVLKQVWRSVHTGCSVHFVEEEP
jgi:folate-dependent phosphoribosylglycinamide formyltransferase PurN